MPGDSRAGMLPGWRYAGCGPFSQVIDQPDKLFTIYVGKIGQAQSGA
jgi:hypothetical protein